MRCKKRTCPSCGLLWAGDTRRKLLANISHYAGDVVLATATAPGRDRLPTPRAMIEWNLSAPGRWRRMHQAARQAAIRNGHTVTLLARTWEYQHRGALHVHVVLGVNTAAELGGAHAYVDELARLRHQHDFGFVDRGRRTGGRRALEVIPAERAARYVAKYLSPLGADGKPTLSQTVTRRDVPGHVAHVSRRLTCETGITMRTLRWRRACHMRGCSPDTGETYNSMIERAMRVGDVPEFERLVQLLGAPDF
jgi:hypothetical protein